MLVVTTDDLPGYRIRQVLGEAIGVTGRTRNPFREGVRKLYGNGSPEIVKALTRWRVEAIEQMTAHAKKLGANAVLGMRFDHRNVSDMWTEICAYGTAVYVERLPSTAPPPNDTSLPPALHQIAEEHAPPESIQPGGPDGANPAAVQ